MRNPKNIIGCLVVVAAFAWCLYQWVIVDEGPAYFAADWRRIVAVVVVSIAGGLLVSFILQLPDEVRYQVGATLFGVFSLLGGGGCVWTIWQFFHVQVSLAEAPVLWWVAAAQFSLCLLVGGLSFSLLRHSRKRHAR